MAEQVELFVVQRRLLDEVEWQTVGKNESEFSYAKQIAANVEADALAPMETRIIRIIGEVVPRG